MSKKLPFSLLALAEMIEACAPSPLAQRVGASTLLGPEHMLSTCGWLRPLALGQQECLLLEAFNAYALHESDRLVTESARRHHRARFNRAYRKLLGGN